MPVPTSIDDLSATAADNSPPGTEAVLPNLDNYLRAAFGFIAELAETASGLADDLAAAVPTGMITMWSGSVVSIPTGWALCDGTGGTPDLRNRFVVCAGGTYAVAASGGAASVSSSSVADHNHGAATGAHTLTSDEMPAHTHALSTLGKAQADGNTNGSAGGMVSYNVGGAGAISNVSASTGGGNSHTHTVADDGGHSHTVATLPPYYALAYIMRTV